MPSTRFVLRALFLSTTLLSAHAAEFKIGEHTLTVPDGFEVELIAGPPLVDRPIVADFDEQGRLYVADSSGSNDHPEKQLAEKPHRIVRLEDTNGDGKFDRSVVFADKMMFPEGAMWFEGSLYVGAPPSIWKLTDTNGDGIADERYEWFQGKTLTGCANDLHGPYLGPDGWIYWNKGAFAEQRHERIGQEPFVSRAAHIFRARPDGSGLEAVMTGGMDNPVETAFSPTGERFFTTTFFQNPEGGKRDGLVHAIYGGLYGKPNDVLDGHPATGGLMPVLTHLGAAAPSGLMTYQHTALGNGFQGNLFAALFNLHKVTRHILTPQGATYVTTDSDFLASDHPDFRPTDVLEDADGSLVVLDTGGWYKICCPTSQLAKPDVLGAIYRVRRTGAPKLNDPRGLQLNWTGVQPDEMAKRLTDARPTVRQRAIRELRKQGSAAVPALQNIITTAFTQVDKTIGAEIRRDAIWALTGINGAEARASVRKLLQDPDESVRHTALNSVSVRRDAGAVAEVRALLKDANPQLRRAAAEALGRMDADDAAHDLLDAAGLAGDDRVLNHSIIFALIEIANPGSTSAGITNPHPAKRRAALIALDQMRNSGMAAEQITGLLTDSNPLVKETAVWIVSRHPEWGAAMADFFQNSFQSLPTDENQRRELETLLSQFLGNETIQPLVTETLSPSNVSLAAKRIALTAIARANLKAAPAAWAEAVASILTARQTELLSPALAAARSLANQKDKVTVLTPALLAVADNEKTDVALRLNALTALPNERRPLAPALFTLVSTHITATQPVNLRNASASVIGRSQLTSEQQLALVETLKQTGPMELPRALGAFEGVNDETIGLKLVEAIGQSKGLAGLRAEILRPRLTNFPVSVQQKAEPLLASMNADAAKQAAHLDQLLSETKGGDIRRGQAIFNSSKAACSACHAIGYLGGRVGPDLTTIGQVRTERDLLESIVFPNVSFVRSYEPVTVVTKSGEDYSGVLRRDNDEEVVLATGPETEVRIPRADIAELRPGTVSVMPSGLDEQLTKAELADLLAFLKSTKWGAQ